MDGEEAVATDNTFGGQNIGLIGSIALMVNNVVGPGIVALPRVFQQAGWLVPTVALSFAFLVSSFACTMTCQAMQMAPGNHRFTNRMEYCDVIAHYLGGRGVGSVRVWYCAAQLLYNICLTCLNVGSIIVTAQTVDQIILFFFGSSYALEVYPTVDWIRETQARLDNSTALPFATDPQGHVNPFVLSLGYAVSLVGIMPMGFMTLEDNIIFQFVAFAAFAVIMCLFLGVFTTQLDPTRLPAVGGNVPQSIGVSMFCYSYAIAIPSWVNEKRKDVSINRTIWWSAFPSTLLKIGFGILGALAYDAMGDNALLTVVENAGSNAWGDFVKLADFLFSLFVIGFGVPLFHIFVRYNLRNGNLCSKWTANFWGVIFPWLISWALYTGDLYQDFLNYSSLGFNAFACFLLPMLVFAVAVRGEPHWRMPSGGEADGLGKAHAGDAEDGDEDDAQDAYGEEATGPAGVDMVVAVPQFLGPPFTFTVAVMALTAAVLVLAIALQIWDGVAGPPDTPDTPKFFLL